MMLTALLLGIIVGALLGLVGGGGSILAVPALVYGVGLPLEEAIPTSLIVVGAASVINSVAGFSAHLTDVHVDWAVTGAFAGTAMLASVIAGRLGRGLPDRVLKTSFAILVLGIAAYVAVRAVTG
jgi:hypothetical protein